MSWKDNCRSLYDNWSWKTFNRKYSKSCNTNILTTSVNFSVCNAHISVCSVFLPLNFLLFSFLSFQQQALLFLYWQWTYWHELASDRMNSRAERWSRPLRCDSWWAEARSCTHRRWSTSLAPEDESGCRGVERRRDCCRSRRGLCGAAEGVSGVGGQGGTHKKIESLAMRLCPVNILKQDVTITVKPLAKIKGSDRPPALPSVYTHI